MSHEIPYRVLLAVDGSVHADQAAQYLARYGATFGVRAITVLYVQPAEALPTHSPDGKEISVDITDLGEKVTAKARRILEAARLPYAHAEFHHASQRRSSDWIVGVSRVWR